jgi:hypothetical protein
MEDFASQVSYTLVKIAKKYQNKHFVDKRESLIINLYSEDLQLMLERNLENVAPLKSQISGLELLQTKT